MVDWLDYDTSPLNPSLKIIIALVFIITLIVYFRLYKNYEGDISQIGKYLTIFCLFVGLGSIARYYGHGTDFGFTKALSLKWFQSIFYLFGAIAYIFVAIKMHKMAPK